MIERTKIFSTSSDFVYLDLRARIVSKELKPSQRLLEVKIATEMGVSRTPVREALRRLAAEGLVRIVPNSGARVASPTANEMESAYSVREYLESMSVELACSNGMDRRLLEKAEDILGNEEAAFAAHDIDAFLDANNSFHRLIASAAKNPVLSEYVDSIMTRTNVYMFFFNKFDASENFSSAEHRAILRAIAKRDKESARSIMKEHLKHSHDTLSFTDGRRAH